jgi:hypothetical protein
MNRKEIQCIAVLVVKLKQQVNISKIPNRILSIDQVMMIKIIQMKMIMKVCCLKYLMKVFTLRIKLAIRKELSLEKI